MMPVDTIWTPDLTVDNAISTNVKPVSTDILVKQDGTVQHAIQLYITVVCGINLFTYPFVRDGCPVALNGWSENTCGLRILYGSVSSVGTNRGEWITLSVELNQDKERLDRNYLYVTMSTNPFNTIVTLLLPSALIMLADLGSFALPLEGGNRSSFKITLVLSFTMSLLILTENLPDTGLCSPLIRYHFCFCLIILVLSLLLSMVLSRFSDSGAILPRKRQKPCESSYINRKDGINKDMTLNGMSTISDEVTAKDASIQKIVTFVENIEKTNEKTKKRHEYASRFDRACFWAYLFLDIVYVICVTLYLNPFNSLVSLVLPTALIMVVDLASFALPLSGERNPFKIKLVFSFTMFLLILSRQLPEGGPCSPLIYYHFCFCLIVLVVSLLVSMMLSRLARTGRILPAKSQKQSGSSSCIQQESAFHQNDTEINSIKANSVDLMTELTSIQKISSFVSTMDKEEMEKNRKQDYAKSWDNFCFVTYLFLDIIYMLCAFSFFNTKRCSSNKLNF
ncbi:5-hydroxytryptamine receptor 3A-like [Silurus meridionalis]|nr:5-hydroxytryptamine receptor 3A-like [Silurus meridionalis]